MVNCCSCKMMYMIAVVATITLVHAAQMKMGIEQLLVVMVFCGLVSFVCWRYLPRDINVWNLQTFTRLDILLDVSSDVSRVSSATNMSKVPKVLEVSNVSKVFSVSKVRTVSEVFKTFSGFNRCIESNICQNLSRSQDIYYYNRIDFYTKLAVPNNINPRTSHSHPVVPRKVHFCLFSNGKLKFKFYHMLAILAAFRFVKPDKIYFWHDNLPIGEYWEETKRRVKNLYLVHRERPTSIYGNPVKVVEHVADIVRLEALLEYGGMYFDTDSIVVNPIDPLLTYDVTLGQEEPRVLCNGIMFSKPWSDFFKIWHKEYRTFDDSEWGAHSVLKPMQLFKSYPKLIHVEPTSLCRPCYGLQKEYLFGPKLWDWQHKNYVVHLYMRQSNGRGCSPEDIKSWNTTVGSIMRYIYFSNATLQSVENQTHVSECNGNTNVISIAAIAVIVWPIYNWHL